MKKNFNNEERKSLDQADSSDPKAFKIIPFPNPEPSPADPMERTASMDLAGPENLGTDPPDKSSTISESQGSSPKEQGEISCFVCQDLLPLYQENLLQPQTKKQVEDHLAACSSCRQMDFGMRSELTAMPSASAIRSESAGPTAQPADLSEVSSHVSSVQAQIENLEDLAELPKVPADLSFASAQFSETGKNAFIAADS